MKLIFVRHGKDDDKYRGGWSNLDLIPEGMEQAKQLAQHLKENNHNYAITYIVSSDLPRTMTTAEFISSELGLPIQRECVFKAGNCSIHILNIDAMEFEMENRIDFLKHN